MTNHIINDCPVPNCIYNFLATEPWVGSKKHNYIVIDILSITTARELYWEIKSTRLIFLDRYISMSSYSDCYFIPYPKQNPKRIYILGINETS